MTDTIYPRSPREVMDGWAHLPRYIDKIRLYLAGKLPAEYHDYLGKNSDALWLQAAGLTHDQMVAIVRDTITDGQVCDWVRINVRRSPEEKATHRRAMLDFPDPNNADAVALFAQRKAIYGLAHRTDLHTRADMLDADEGRV